MADPDTDVTRRAYWTEQFDAAYRFMFEAVLPYPVAECGEPMVSLREAADVAHVTVQFSERPHVNGLPRLYYLRDGQIPGFIGAAAEMNERGWVLRVEDGYRTPEMQKYLGRTPQVFDAVLGSVMWELGGRAADARVHVPPLLGAGGQRAQVRHPHVGQRHRHLGDAPGRPDSARSTAAHPTWRCRR